VLGVSSDHDPYSDPVVEPHEVDERGRRLSAEEQLERRDFDWLMRDKIGRRVVWRLMDLCGVPTGDHFSTNAMQMARNLGMAEIGKRLHILAQASGLDQFRSMIEEAASRDRASRSKR
jgi:hypothetical protein